MVCIQVRGNQSRRVDMFNIAERISGVINVVVGVLVICHELSQDRVISRTHNQLRGTGAIHRAECCRGISLARSFSQAEVLGNLSLGVLVVNKRAGKRDTSISAGGKTFNRQYTVTGNGHSTTFTSQGLQRQIGIFCHSGGTLCCRLQGLDSENTVINSHRTTGQGHFGVEVTVTLCCTGSVITQHELTTVLNRNSRRNNLLGGCIRVFIGLDQFLGSIRQRAVKGQHLAFNRHTRDSGRADLDIAFIDDHDGVEGDSRAICLIHLVDVDGFTLRNLVLLVASADDCVHDNKHLLLYTRRNLRLRRCAL